MIRVSCKGRVELEEHFRERRHVPEDWLDDIDRIEDTRGPETGLTWELLNGTKWVCVAGPISDYACTIGPVCEGGDA